MKMMKTGMKLLAAALVAAGLLSSCSGVADPGPVTPPTDYVTPLPHGK
jgi:ABC-type glycerol-3-phosphate transport system substrate-binding protein